MLGKDAALPRQVKVQRVHMEGRLAARRLAGDKHIDLQQFVTQILVKATDAVTALALLDEDVFAAYLDRNVYRRRGRCRGWLRLCRCNRLRFGG